MAVQNSCLPTAKPQHGVGQGLTLLAQLEGIAQCTHDFHDITKPARIRMAMILVYYNCSARKAVQHINFILDAILQDFVMVADHIDFTAIQSYKTHKGGATHFNTIV